MPLATRAKACHIAQGKEGFLLVGRLFGLFFPLNSCKLVVERRFEPKAMARFLSESIG